MISLSLDALDPHTLEGSPLAVSRPSKPIQLLPFPGATGIRTTLRADTLAIACAEMPTPLGRPVTFEVTTGDRPTLKRTDGGEIFYLPAESVPAHEPKRLPPAAALDLVLIIDATWLASSPGGAPIRLLADREAWNKVSSQLLSLAAGLAATSPLRVAVISFGDHRPPFPVAADLFPAFLLNPPATEVAFETYDPGRLGQTLERLEPCAGGDFVDGLAEALAASATLPFHPDHRRLVLVAGDSPGYSIDIPAPMRAAAFSRALDVDTAALHLHEKNIEIATLWSPATLPEPVSRDAIALRRFAQEQYRRLASLPQWALEMQHPIGPAAARLQERPDVLARGFALGYPVA